MRDGSGRRKFMAITLRIERRSRLGCASLPRAARITSELQILIRRRVRMERDEPEPRLLDARADAVQEAQLPQRRRHDPLVGQALDLVQQRFAALEVELAGL